MARPITTVPPHPNRRIALASLALAAAAPGTLAHAENDTFPNKPLKIIVPSSPGGQMDIAARLIGPKLADYWKVSVVVENKPGGGMAIGTRQAAESPADGYTLLLAHEGAIVLNPVVVEQTAYSVKSFEPLTQVWDTALILVVNKDLPVKDLRELDGYVKAHPGKLNYPVADTISGLMSDMIRRQMAWDYVDISYKGNADRFHSLMAGETQLTLMSAGDAVTAIKSGRVRAIGISSATRSPRLPDIPTLEEAGMKGFKLMTWGGLFVPAGTPADIAAKLSAGARRALAEPDVVESIEAGGSQATPTTPDQFRQRIAADVVRWRLLAEGRGMKTFDR